MEKRLIGEIIVWVIIILIAIVVATSAWDRDTDGDDGSSTSNDNGWNITQVRIDKKNINMTYTNKDETSKIFCRVPIIIQPNGTQYGADLEGYRMNGYLHDNNGLKVDTYKMLHRWIRGTEFVVVELTFELNKIIDEGDQYYIEFILTYGVDNERIQSCHKPFYA